MDIKEKIRKIFMEFLPREGVTKSMDRAYELLSPQACIEDYRCNVTQGILSEVRENEELTKFINELDGKYMSSLTNPEGDK